MGQWHIAQPALPGEDEHLYLWPMSQRFVLLATSPTLNQSFGPSGPYTRSGLSASVAPRPQLLSRLHVRGAAQACHGDRLRLFCEALP
jgi:hypothetical protein